MFFLFGFNLDTLAPGYWCDSMQENSVENVPLLFIFFWLSHGYVWQITPLPSQCNVLLAQFPITLISVFKMARSFSFVSELAGV